jgi:alpha-tubulin suppressor-like RCC1 family protein
MSATISKASLLTEIDAIVSGLNLSTEETYRLALFYKTAINAGGEESTAIANEIISRLENTSSEKSLSELLLLVVASTMITEDRMVAVPDLTTLGNLSSTISAGSIYFVESENLPYIKKSDGTWVIIDPSLQIPATVNLYGWGSNNAGGLGDGTIISRSSPVSVVGGFTDWIQASGGSGHSLGLRANGTLWSWGGNYYGYLGDGTTIYRSSPVSVVGGFTDWIQASAGGGHSLGLRANGTIWSWGYNSLGNLGDGTNYTRSSPVSVVGGFTDWIQTSAGNSHNLGLRANGTLWSWGSSNAGRLGDGTIISRSSPVSVIGGFTNWIQASAGGNHSLGLRANGTLWSWGSNGSGSGRLGDGTIIYRSSPVSVVGGFTDWIQASAGSNHSLGLRANGTLWSWGYNAGRLGDGTFISRSSPVSVIGGFTDWIQTSAGGTHSLGLRANGTLWSWGLNNYGRLGDGTIIIRSSPVSVVGGFTDWIQASGGVFHNLGVRAV